MTSLFMEHVKTIQSPRIPDEIYMAFRENVELFYVTIPDIFFN